MAGCRKWESEADLVGSSLLVGLGRSVGLGLLRLVRERVASGVDTIANVGVVVLSNRLVGLLGSLVASASDLVRDVVTGVLDGIHVDDWGWLV